MTHGWPAGVEPSQRRQLRMEPRSRSSRPATDGPPLLLVHGTTADHTTFRVVGPRFAGTRAVHAIDRRGRGASGDTLPYSIEREFEDVAAVAEALAATSGRASTSIGHSYGGRCALGAAMRTDAIRRVVCYEGAPTPPGVSVPPAGVGGATLRAGFRPATGMVPSRRSWPRSSA